MKKTYIAPEMMVVKLGTTQMIAQSPGYDPNQKTSASSGNLSREVIDDPDAWEEW